MKFKSTKSDINKGIMTDNSIREIIKAESLLKRSEELLRHCKSQVGMVLGEQIEEFLSEFNDQKFSPQTYHHERLPDGQ